MKQKRVNCPDCNLLVAEPRLRVHQESNFCWGDEYKITTPDDIVLWEYWKYKKNNNLKGPVRFMLSPLQLLSLLDDAGITISQVGNGKGLYNLARHGDKGDYEIGNCRFIPQIDNLNERDFGLRYIVDGTEYSNTKDVADKFGCGRATVRRRCESPKHPTWELVTL